MRSNSTVALIVALSVGLLSTAAFAASTQPRTNGSTVPGGNPNTCTVLCPIPGDAEVSVRDCSDKLKDLRRITASQALAIGLVHAVHAADQIGAALDAVLADILACAPGAISATKSLIAKARLTPPADLVLQAALVFSRAAQGAEGLEGVTAFIQKRKPNWAL